MPTERNRRPKMTYPLGRDDQVLLTLQYSTQWDRLAHVGQLSGGDGDGVPEIVFHNGYRPGEHIPLRAASRRVPRAGKFRRDRPRGRPRQR
jgi:hypothetical protein